MNKKSLFLVSNMIVQPVGRILEKQYRVSYADLDTIVQTLHTTIDSDYLLLMLDPRFFYDLYIDEAAFERALFLESLLRDFRSRNSARIIVTNLFDRFLPFHTGHQNRQYLELLKLNQRLEEMKNSVADLEICDLFDLGMRIGYERMFNDTNRFLFQSPFSREGARALAEELERTLRRFESKRKKVLVLDGDNTLWGGIVGEDGVDGVQCDENYPGIVYKRFQRYLKRLRQSGLVLAIVSKNNEKDVRELFEKKNMPLAWEDFVIRKINWQPKSVNIREIAHELNLGLDSLLFIDDNPFEIEEVKSALPSVETLRFDKEEPLSIFETLSGLPEIHAIVITEEDRKKSLQYLQERERAEVMKQTSDIEEFIKSLDIKITWWLNNKRQLARITQLINKTNQFNLTTRRYSEAEVEQMMEKEKVFSFRVEDRFGDMGIVGVLIVKGEEIDVFLLSCRVLGRGIEERLLDPVLEVCGESLEALYIPSPKNTQVENLYERLGFALLKVDEEGKKHYRFKQRPEGKEYITIMRGE